MRCILWISLSIETTVEPSKPILSMNDNCMNRILLKRSRSTPRDRGSNSRRKEGENGEDISGPYLYRDVPTDRRDRSDVQLRGLERQEQCQRIIYTGIRVYYNAFCHL